MTTLRTLAVYLEANIKNYQTNMKAAGESTQKLHDGLNKMSEVAAGVVVAGVGAVTGAIALSIKQTTDWGETLEHTTEILGTTSSESAGLGYMMQTIGGDASQVTDAMSKMAKGVLTAKGTLGPTGLEMQKLGINALDAQGNIRPAAGLFEEIATKVNAMPEGLDKTSAMMGIFGKSGKEMSDVLAAAANGGLDQYIQKAKDVGLALTPEQVEQTKANGRAWNELNLAFQGISVTIGMSFMPVLKDLAEQLRSKLADPAVQARIKTLAEDLGKFATDNAPKLLSLVDGLIKLVDSLTKIPAPVYGVIGVLTALVIAIGPVWTAIQSIISIWGVLSGVMATLTSVTLPAIGAALAAIGWPVILLVAAIGLLVWTIINFGSQAWNTVTMIGAIISTEFGRAVDWVNHLGDAFGGIGQAISKALGWLMKLDGLLIGLKIPDWLTPGSPTPFEMGIRGVSSAMQDAVNQSLPQFQAKLSMVGTASPVQSASQNQTPSLSNADGFDFDYNRLARAIRDGLLTSGMAN